MKKFTFTLLLILALSVSSDATIHLFGGLEDSGHISIYPSVIVPLSFDNVGLDLAGGIGIVGDTIDLQFSVGTLSVGFDGQIRLSGTFVMPRLGLYSDDIFSFIIGLSASLETISPQFHVEAVLSDYLELYFNTFVGLPYNDLSYITLVAMVSTEFNFVIGSVFVDYGFHYLIPDYSIYHMLVPGIGIDLIGCIRLGYRVFEKEIVLMFEKSFEVF